jgi:sugar phosphate isomerase/epimerase
VTANSTLPGAGPADVTARRSFGVAAFEYQLPLVEKLARVASAGADCCELATPGDVTTANVSECAATIQASGVRVSAVCSLSKPNSPDGTELGLHLLEQSIRCADALGAPAVIAYFGAHPERSAADAISRYRDIVRPLVDLAEQKRITILIENHFSHARGDVTSGPEGCGELIEAVGSAYFALNFDPCNFAIAGIDVASAYEMLRPLVRNVHVKDARPYDPVVDADYPGRVVEDINRGRFIFVPVTEGITDNTTILDVLKRDGYRGPVTVEAHTPQETLDDVFARGLSFCREHA